MYKVRISYDSNPTNETTNMRFASIRELRRAITILLEEKHDGTRVVTPMSAEIFMHIHDGKDSGKNA